MKREKIVADRRTSTQISSDRAIAGKANCGCVYHAEDGIPCEHDIELAEKEGRKT